MDDLDFPPEEFERRLERAHRAMSAAHLDALFFMTEPEIRYFTGFRTPFWQSPTRPWFLVVPNGQKPIAIIPEIGVELMKRGSIGQVMSWSSPHETDDGISLLFSVLKKFPRIGLMKGRESVLRMSLADFEALQAQLNECEFVDSTSLVQDLRAIKSVAEIFVLDRICKIATSSFEHADRLFRIGQPLRDVFRTFRIDLLNGGADDVPYLVGSAGQDGYQDIISPPDDRKLNAGDILMLDTGATLKGYFCDIDRNFAFEKASDRAKDVYRILYRATEKALEKARPGVTCAQLFEVMANEIGMSDSAVGRFGHGLGMQLTEGVSLAHFDHTPLQENMVITLEPSMQISEDRFMVHEENIVICDGPPKLLSKRAASELPVL